MQDEVRAEGLWGAHLGPELGGKGFGQLKLALINEILGTSSWAPIVFGTAAPDTGNAEIIAHYGTEAQKEKYLQPLLNGECFSCYSMTEPHAGADPKMFTTRAVKDGDEWVINGYKFFSSNARTARFIIVMAVTDPDVSAYQGMSMFLVPTDTPGLDVERHIGLMGEGPDEGMHALIHYNDCRVPADALLGGEGQAFAVAQTRLGGGRVHHAMRTVGVCQKALDMMCERALSRETQGSILADKQMVQSDIADAYAELIQFRLLVLYTAWEIDRYHDYKRVRKNIATIKFLTPEGAGEHRVQGDAPPRRAGRVERDAVRQHVVGRADHGVGRRPERGAQGHRGQGSAQGLQAGRRPVAVGVAAGEAGRGAQEDRQHARAHHRELLSARSGRMRVRRRDGARPVGRTRRARSRRCTSASTAPTCSGSTRRPARRRTTKRCGATPTAPSRSSPRPTASVQELASRRRRRRRRPARRRARAPPGSTPSSSARRQPVAGPRVDAAARASGPAPPTCPDDELLLWAWTGLAAQQPGATSDHPVAPVVPIITYEQGALGATAIAAALIERAHARCGAVAHGVGPARGERDEHVDPDRPARDLPAVRRATRTAPGCRRSSACTAAATACGCSCAR